MTKDYPVSETSNRNSQKGVRDPIRKTFDPLEGFTRLSGQALCETEDAIAKRQKLTRRFLREIEKEIAEAVRMLRLLGDPWQHGDKTEYEFMRISLDKALTARKKERRARLLEEWKDLLALNEKRIELLRQNLAHSIGSTVPNRTGSPIKQQFDSATS